MGAMLHATRCNVLRRARRDASIVDQRRRVAAVRVDREALEAPCSELSLGRGQPRRALVVRDVDVHGHMHV
jgi:hypothetical protein